MTTPINEPVSPQEVEPLEAELQSDVTTAAEHTEADDERRRRMLLILLLLLLVCLCCVGALFVRYMMKPQPLPEMVPVVSENICYPPAYKLSVPLDKPLGVAASPDGQRFYGVESGGERMIKIFDRNGKLIKSFAPPFTDKSNRKPIYIAVDITGRVFVTDAYNDVVGVFDPDGNFLDGIIGKGLTLSEFIADSTGKELPARSLFYFDNITKNVIYQTPDGEKKSIPFPPEEEVSWSPLGLRFDPAGNFMITNIVSGKHSVIVYPVADINGSLTAFDPQFKEFGVEGNDAGEFSFPNSVVTDSIGNFYVSDSNNGRISVWTPDMKYTNFFGLGSSDQSLNLPRGLWMYKNGCLHVVDNVGQYIRVYNVSGAEPTFQFNVGDYGIEEGQFNFPNDITIDVTGRLYVADSENNRIQVWSY